MRGQRGSARATRRHDGGPRPQRYRGPDGMKPPLQAGGADWPLMTMDGQDVPMRRTLLGLVLVLAVAPPAPAATAAVPVVIIDGRGFGHGVGMAQDGAYWMGRAGASTAQI